MTAPDNKPPKTNDAVEMEDLEIGRWYWISWIDDAEPDLAKLTEFGWAVILHDCEVQNEVTVHAGPIEPFDATLAGKPFTWTPHLPRA